jgi:hypothetical protein
MVNLGVDSKDLDNLGELESLRVMVEQRIPIKA